MLMQGVSGSNTSRQVQSHILDVFFQQTMQRELVDGFMFSQGLTT